MKAAIRILLTLTLLQIGTESFSQISGGTIDGSTKKMDNESFYRFIARNIKYPFDARSASKQGDVYVSFQIDSIGMINNLVLINDIGGGCGQEVLRVINEIPKDYLPEASNSLYILPIRFILDKRKNEKPQDVKLPTGEKLGEIVVTAIGN